MAGTKISALTNGGAVQATDTIPAVREGANVKVFVDFAAPPAIGGTTAAAGTFTNLTASQSYETQAAPIAKTSDATLTIAELLTGIITVTSATAVTLTLPSGALTDAGLLDGALAVEKSFDWVVMNLGSVAGIVTIAPGDGHTLSGEEIIPLPAATLSGAGVFRTRKTAANTFVTYRIS